MSGVWRQRMWWLSAQARRHVSRSGSARGARAATTGATRRRTSEWTAQLARHHAAYRSSVEPLDASLAVVCVTSRPHLLTTLLESVARQRYPIAEVVLVINSAGYDDVDVESVLDARADRLPEVRVLRRPAERSLGSCLNDGLDAVDARFVAKFDDDDLYGASYLSDTMRAHRYAGAGVVGKHTYYAHLVSDDRTVLRFPAHEFSYSSTLAGGTLVIDRERTEDLRFEDVSIGEDRAFIAQCLRHGIATFSADRFGFVQTRSGDNTWAVDVDRFLVGTVDVGPGRAAEALET